MKYIYIISFNYSKPCSQENEINKSNLKYLALGDSYTIGENIAFEDAYPNQIVRELSLIDSVNVIAKTGWTTNELIDTLSKSYLDKYDIVSLLIESIINLGDIKLRNMLWNLKIYLLEP